MVLHVVSVRVQHIYVLKRLTFVENVECETCFKLILRFVMAFNSISNRNSLVVFIVF